MGRHAPAHGAVPHHHDAGRRRVFVQPVGAPGGPDLRGAADDGHRGVARCNGAGRAGPGAQSHRAEAAGAGPVRLRAQLRTPGLRRHHAVDEGRQQQGRARQRLVPGAQEDRRRPPGVPRRRARPILQRRVQRPLQRALCAERARSLDGRAADGHRRGEAPPAERARRGQGRRAGQAGRARVCGGLHAATGGTGHPALRRLRCAGAAEPGDAGGFGRHHARPRAGAGGRPPRRRAGRLERHAGGRRPVASAGRRRHRAV
jgi:hypothetical protein